MHYLFIHGSWHGAWCWEKLTPYFHNHQVTCLDLPGSGERFNEIDQVTLEVLVDSVRQVLRESSSPMTLIAHSSSGLIVAELVEEFHEKIHHAFYLAAWLPREGFSLIDMAIGYNNSELPSIFVEASNPQWAAISQEGAKSVFYHDCSVEDQLFAATRIKPKNSLPDKTKHPGVSTRYGLAKSTYILCTEDKVVKPSSQLDIAIRYGFIEEQIIHFPSGHSPFLAKPEALAKIILGND